MKKILTFCILLTLFSLKTFGQENPEKINDKVKIAYTSYGVMITDDNVLNIQDLKGKYLSMSSSDTLTIKMIGKVNEVCQAKGCWMTLDLQNGEEVMVKFKDYGFFMPKDISGKEVILNGKAFVNEVPVDELRHYAEDAGKSADDIAAITKPKKTFSFEADGVLIKK